MAASKKLSKKQIKFFADCVYEWQATLGLMDWFITVKSEDLSSIEGARAVVNYDFDQHMALIAVHSEMPEIPTESELNRYALHECLHLRLADLQNLVPPQLAEQASALEHAVIRNLENILIGRS